MARYLLLVFTRPRPGREDDYHRWYDESHLAEVLGVPGFVAARRYAVIDLPPASPASEFAALYTIESDDIAATMATFDRQRATMPVPPSLDVASVSFRLLGELGPERARP